MQTDPERPQLTHRGGRSGAQGPGLLTKVLAVVVGAAVLVGAIAVSLVVFAIALAGVLVFGGYVWWKTRHLRRQMREMRDVPDARDARERTPGGTIIEGEVLRKSDRDEGSAPGRSGSGGRGADERAP
jgi:hypothetical protein